MVTSVLDVAQRVPVGVLVVAEPVGVLVQAVVLQAVLVLALAAVLVQPKR